MERRDFLLAGLIWLVITVASWVLIFFALDPFPVLGSEEAEIVDQAFTVMTYMSAPVFGVVIAVLLMSLLRWRAGGAGTDGPPELGTNWVPKAWFVATAALAVVVMIYPGLVGIAEIRGEDTADLEVDVLGFQWAWLVTYPESGVRVSDELVLPADTRIKFNVSAADVLHSFWIPSLGPKIDAVPGKTTELYITTTDPGDRSVDFAGYRLQCAELCGLNHTTMTMDVRVVERAEFEAWLADRQTSASKAR